MRLIISQQRTYLRADRSAEHQACYASCGVFSRTVPVLSLRDDYADAPSPIIARGDYTAGATI